MFEVWHVVLQSDMIKFHYILNKDYSSWYDDIQNLTVYFEIKDNFIIGGAYNLRSKQKISRRKLISVTVNTPYTYKNERKLQCEGSEIF